MVVAVALGCGFGDLGGGRGVDGFVELLVAAAVEAVALAAPRTGGEGCGGVGSPDALVSPRSKCETRVRALGAVSLERTWRS